MNLKGVRDSSPCRHCADRAIGCHGVCKDYNDWKIDLQKKTKEEREHMPHVIRGCDFTGTSPKPGTKRRTKGSKH